MNSENVQPSRWRSRAVYALLAVVYLAWLAILSAYPGHDILRETFAGKIISAILALFGLSVVPTSWSVSAAAEARLALGPGSITGLIIGALYVRAARDIWKALVPAGILLALLLALAVLPQSIWLALAAVPAILATAIPYAVIGAVIGWKVATRGHTRPPMRRPAPSIL